jgi:hypothetical protein
MRKRSRIRNIYFFISINWKDEVKTYRQDVLVALTTRLQEVERKQHVLIIDQLPLPSFPFSVILSFILSNDQT